MASKSGRRSRSPEESLPRKKNRSGTQLWGPSGAPIWTSPAIDVRRNAVYVTTGNNYSDPATNTSDAFVAFDLSSGKMRWSRQLTSADAWNTSCRAPDAVNCAEANGPDFDFASPPILVTLSNGQRALVAGQKSGLVHAVDPDREGQILWQTRVGKGGINGGVQWGSAADQSRMLRGAVGHCANLGPQQPGYRTRPEGRRRDLRAAPRQRRARVANAPGRVRHTKTVQPSSICRGQRDSWRGVLGIGGRTPACLFDIRRQRDLGFRHRSRLRDGEWCVGARRFSKRGRPRDQRGDHDRQFGIRAEWNTRKRSACVLGGRQNRGRWRVRSYFAALAAAASAAREPFRMLVIA